MLGWGGEARLGTARGGAVATASWDQQPAPKVVAFTHPYPARLACFQSLDYITSAFACFLSPQHHVPRPPPRQMDVFAVSAGAPFSPSL